MAGKAEGALDPTGILGDREESCEESCEELCKECAKRQKKLDVHDLEKQSIGPLIFCLKMKTTMARHTG